MSKDYKHIQTKEDYTKLLNSGMFWEFHPELSGNWQDDERVIKNINYDTDTCHVFVKSYVIDPVAKALWNDIINDKQPMDTRQQIVDILDHFTQCLGVDLDGSDVYGIHDNKLNELTEILVSVLKQ